MKTTLLILLLGISLVAQAQSVAEEILTQNRAMETAYNNGELTAIANFYSSEAHIIGPRTFIEGNEAVVNYWKGLEGRHVRWRLENNEILPYGEIAIQRGVSYLTFMYEGKEVESVVRFTLLWIQEDGSWKIKIDHYSPL
ncbi:YybH family protein [Altibacter sp. HG106]|uniref:YybH family protein n=1 Tax=Altibacter sp. HG106 TaxID=3023937 RepID=UPI0023508CD5|nr:nuclear transport factor 2 family protein [Altibacter sp. HG106]MDC7994063.1 nuclear transport factor 2 family protein [Altibacter sp. HG106]